MKAAVVTKDHHVDVTDKTLRSLKHGEALQQAIDDNFWQAEYRDYRRTSI